MVWDQRLLSAKGETYLNRESPEFGYFHREPISALRARYLRALIFPILGMIDRPLANPLGLLSHLKQAHQSLEIFFAAFAAATPDGIPRTPCLSQHSHHAVKQLLKNNAHCIMGQ